MGLWRWLGGLARALAVPALLFGLAGFFVWHAENGGRGERMGAQRELEIAAAREALAQAVREREAAERRVAALRGAELDRDQLEERTRAMLNLTTRDEIVVPYPQGRRLFP